MRRSVTASGRLWRGRTSRATVAALLLTSGALAGLPPAYAISPPTVDPGAVPPDGPPGPVAPMKQNTYCTEVGVIPGTDFKLQPKYMDMLNLQEAWQFGRGAGQKVAVIDTGVTPHPRFAPDSGRRLHNVRRRVVGLRRPRHHRGLDDRRSAGQRCSSAARRTAQAGHDSHHRAAPESTTATDGDLVAVASDRDDGSRAAPVGGSSSSGTVRISAATAACSAATTGGAGTRSGTGRTRSGTGGTRSGTGG